MKHLIITLILTTSLLANERIWSSHSAEILEQGRWEIGLFQPLRYGYSNDAELSIHPGWFFLIPNLEVKESQKNFLGYKTASKYKLTYPTILLNMLSGDGIGKFIAPEHEIPHMFSFSGALVGTRSFKEIDVTLSGGLDIGIVLGDLNSNSTIDLPLVYHRLGVFYNGWGFHTGIDIERAINAKIEILLDLDLIALPGYNGNYSIENKLLLSWNKSRDFRVTTGYKFISGEFPYGEDSRLLPYIPILERWVPIVELQWARNKK